MIYETIYNNLIQKRQIEIPKGYTEEHHIIPKSFGGNDDKSNLVMLTAREHYLAHYLLMKMQIKNSANYFSMVKAFLVMQVDNGTGLRYIPSHKFEELRKIDSERKSLEYVGNGNPSYGTMWVCNPDTGENRKIKKIDSIPFGYVVGRNKIKKVCSECETIFYNNRKYCSEKCKNNNIGQNGEENHSSKLTFDKVLYIRNVLIKNKVSNTEIGKMYGVSDVAIYNIKINKTWRDSSIG